MQTIEHEPAGPAGNETGPQAKGKWSRRLIVGGVAIAALAGVGVAGALSQDFGGMHRFGMGEGGMQQAAFRHHGPGFGMGGPGIGRMLSGIDATAEQKDKLEAIMDTLHDDVRPIMRSFRDTREELTDLLAAPTVDAAAVEKLRAERLAGVDEASKKVAAALVQAAAVLTPEQRAKLKENFEDRGWGRRW